MILDQLNNDIVCLDMGWKPGPPAHGAFKRILRLNTYHFCVPVSYEIEFAIR